MPSLVANKLTLHNANNSPASQPQLKYRTGKKPNYRRYWPFSRGNIGD